MWPADQSKSSWFFHHKTDNSHPELAIKAKKGNYHNLFLNNTLYDEKLFFLSNMYTNQLEQNVRTIYKRSNHLKTYHAICRPNYVYETSVYWRLVIQTNPYSSQNVSSLTYRRQQHKRLVEVNRCQVRSDMDRRCQARLCEFRQCHFMFWRPDEVRRSQGRSGEVRGGQAR